MDRFEVTIPQRELDRLAEFEAWCVENGCVPEFIATLKELNYRLEVEPHEWGESREYLPVMGLQLRWAACRLIDVMYGVDEVSRRVFVKQFRLNRSFKR